MLTTEEHSIEIVLSVTGQALTMLVIDEGQAFDASQVPPPDLSLAIEQRPIGGLGIHLLRELSDGMSYERREGKNRLTLTKRFR
jgi:serine/threonine-protein kinase RsbW